MSEAAPPQLQPAELLQWWQTLPASAGPARVLALDGRSGAGKTLLAARLAVLAPNAVVVHLDAVYPGWDGLADTPGLLVRQLLEPLAAGRPAGYRRWDWAAGRDGDRQPLPEPLPPLLLLDGIGSGSLLCAPYLAGLVWLEADTQLRRTRALDRDGDGYAPHWQRWADQEQRYLQRERPRERADLVLDAGGDPLLVLTDRRPDRRP
jgi:hypothetical protein